MSVIPFSLRNAPSLIEVAFPAQKVSHESFKEQMSGAAKTLTALGSYWKGRKPLVLNKAVILGCLLPVSDDVDRDMEIFELLMGMDDAAFRKRLPANSPLLRRIGRTPYRELVRAGERAENVPDLLDDVWGKVNKHLGTSAGSLPELVEQLGIMRFGRRPKFADVFSGSGQIPFEAARLGLDTFASDLNPIACMLTWGALNVVGGKPEERAALNEATKVVCDAVEHELDGLGVELDGDGWRAKAFLYCVEVKCPETGWMVPLMPSRVISVKRRILAELEPDPDNMRYDIVVRGGSAKEMKAAEVGTIQKAGRGAESFVVHCPDPDGKNVVRVPYVRIREGVAETYGGKAPGLRLWELSDVAPLPTDTLQERLYAILWQRPRDNGKQLDLKYRSVTPADLEREATVLQYVTENLAEWQDKGYVPNMRIESGTKTDEPIRTRGWTHWHHLYNPRQLLTLSLLFKHASSHKEYAKLAFGLGRALDFSSRLGRWLSTGDIPTQVFYNQALNTLFNYGTRGSTAIRSLLEANYKSFPSPHSSMIKSQPAQEMSIGVDIAVTDAPYGDAVHYDEIYDYFIAWFKKNPPKEFADWTWDSRRALAVKDNDHNFKKAMIQIYSNLADHMPPNGIQVLMFTHTSEKLWADLANIVWGAGLQVLNAWNVATETEGGLKTGGFVKGTVLLVLKKRTDNLGTFQDDLTYEIEQEVNQQIAVLTGMNARVRSASARGENMFNDADLQLAAYAAALKVLTRYGSIDGKDMVVEAGRLRGKGELALVDRLVQFAVDLANAALVPEGLSSEVWRSLAGVERFYLRMLEQEVKGVGSLHDLQQFAKAFKVKDVASVMASMKANAVRLKGSSEFRGALMGDGAEFGGTVLRSTLYGMYLCSIDGGEKDDVLKKLRANDPAYFARRQTIITLAKHLRDSLVTVRPEESKLAGMLFDFVRTEGA